MRKILVALLLVWAFTSSAVLAADQQPSQSFARRTTNTQILKGMKQIAISIAQLDDWLVSHKISQDTLKAQAVKKLDAAGIEVVTEPAQKQLGQGMESPPSIPVLSIQFKTIPEENTADFGAYTAKLSLVDSVLTKRNQHELLVAIWDTVDVGNLKQNMSDELSWALNKQLDSFLTDWKIANP